MRYSSRLDARRHRSSKAHASHPRHSRTSRRRSTRKRRGMRCARASRGLRKRRGARRTISIVPSRRRGASRARADRAARRTRRGPRSGHVVCAARRSRVARRGPRRRAARRARRRPRRERGRHARRHAESPTSRRTASCSTRRDPMPGSSPPRKACPWTPRRCDSVTGAIQPFLPRGDRTPRHGGDGCPRCRCSCTRIRSMPRARRAGRAPVTGIWISGGRHARARLSPPAIGEISATAHPAGDVARGLARAAGPIAPTRRRPTSTRLAGDDALVVLAPVDRCRAAPRAGARVARSRASRRSTRGDLDELAWCCGNGGGTDARWSAHAPSLFARLRAHFRGTRGRAMTTLVRRPAHPAAAALEAAGLSPVLARIYAARGIASTAELDHSLAALPTFAALRGIDDAAARLAQAIAQQERIVIVADYDADGATACAVGVRGLRALGARRRLPRAQSLRVRLRPHAGDRGAGGAASPALIVTVDNGIASVDGVAAAHALGIEVLVTDHHLPGPALPAPAIIVNPNQPGCTFPSKHIAGVGVMFYVLLATRARLRADGAFAARAEPNLARAARPRGARHRGRRRAPRPGQSRARGAGPRAHARRQRASGRARALRRRRSRPRARDGLRPGLRGRAAPQRRRAPRRHDHRHPLPPRRRRARRRTSRAELDALNRERRDVEAGMQDEALADLADIEADDDQLHACACSAPEWHQGVVGIVAVAAQGPLPPSGVRVCPRGTAASCAARAARSPASTCATRSTS